MENAVVQKSKSSQVTQSHMPRWFTASQWLSPSIHPNYFAGLFSFSLSPSSLLLSFIYLFAEKYFLSSSSLLFELILLHLPPFFVLSFLLSTYSYSSRIFQLRVLSICLISYHALQVQGRTHLREAQGWGRAYPSEVRRPHSGTYMKLVSLSLSVCLCSTCSSKGGNGWFCRHRWLVRVADITPLPNNRSSARRSRSQISLSSTRRSTSFQPTLLSDSLSMSSVSA